MSTKKMSIKNPHNVEPDPQKVDLKAEPTLAKAGWPRSIRLRRRNDFSQIQRSGARAGNDFIVALCRRTRSRDAIGRVGFAVSKKVGNAPVRNLIKRRLRHIARTHKELWQGLDVVLVIRPDARTADFNQLKIAVEDAITRSRTALQNKKSRPRRPAKR